MGKMFKSACKSHLGKDKKNIDDYIFSNDDLGLFIVADGIGGLPAATTASQLVTESIEKYISQFDLTKCPPIEIKEIMKKAVLKASAIIIDEGKKHEEYFGMGTTVVFAVVVGHYLYVCNVGDSRAYLISPRGIAQLSEDQTLYQEIIKQIYIPIDHDLMEKSKHVLTQHVGNYRLPEPYIDVISLNDDASLLLCTDGLTDALEVMEIHDMVMNGFGTLQDKVNSLVETAYQRNSCDDISALLVTKDHRVYV